MSAIKSRGWGVDLYVIEVGTRGFCSRSLLCCLKNLDSNNILAKKNLKNCEQTLNGNFFYIWQARDNLVWQSVELNSLANTTPLESSSPSISEGKIKNNLLNPPTPSKSPVGFMNKGNTCYANIILQALSVIPLLWGTSPVESAQLSLLLKSIALNMAIRSAVPIDPSNFLWALKWKISSTRNAPFDFNSQQCVAKILQVVLDELKETSIRNNDLLSNTFKTTITCHNCFCFAVREEKLDIVSVPMADVNISLEKFTSSELLTLENEWFCSSYNSFNPILNGIFYEHSMNGGQGMRGEA